MVESAGGTKYWIGTLACGRANSASDKPGLLGAVEKTVLAGL